MSELATIGAVKAFILKESERLDPESRYVKELLAQLDRFSGVANLEYWLSGNNRGRYWAGEEAWRWMTLEEKLRANLITNETKMMRFNLWEADTLQKRIIPFLYTKSTQRRVDVLSLPCSHGEEAVSLASEFMEAGIQDFTISGFDIQGACIQVARSGNFPISGLPKYVTAQVAPEIMKHLWFEVADIFTMQTGLKQYDLVVCRNFLGYFKYEVAKEILAKLSDLMADESYLMLDTFVVQKYGGLMDDFYAVEVRAEGIPGPTPFFFRHKKGMEAVGRVTEREMR